VSTVKHKSAYTFSDRLRELMAVKGMKQVPLADKTGVTQPAVSGWLNGSMPDADQLVRISDALDVSIDYLLKGLPGIKRPDAGWNSKPSVPEKLLEELFADAIEIESRAQRLRSKLEKLKPLSSGKTVESGAARIFDAAKQEVGAKVEQPSPAVSPSDGAPQGSDVPPRPGRHSKKQNH
jgi:transcriptional regulator with XRE-family HTH domain